MCERVRTSAREEREVQIEKKKRSIIGHVMWSERGSYLNTD